MDQNVQKLRVDRDKRVESGAVAFEYNNGEDWPGLFLRGDDSFALSLNIWTLCESLKGINLPVCASIALLQLKGIAEDIQKDVVVGGGAVKFSPES